MHEIIKSISYSQEEILKWILQLYCPDGFDLDPTYSKGVFYKNVPPPRLKYDLNPQIEGVQQADCTNLPLETRSLKSIVFDLPFVAGIGKKGKPGIIRTRFGSYKDIQNELWGMYHKALREFHRILKFDGVLVFKCQDTISSSKQYLSHVEIINVAIKLGFYPKDLFILLAKSRLMSPNMRIQQHARKFHSYFLVFIKQESSVKYSNNLKDNKKRESNICLKDKDDKRQQIINAAVANLKR